MMSKGGKEITLPLRDVSGRNVVMGGGEEVVHIQSNNQALSVERKVDSALATHLTFFMHYKLGTIQISRVA